MRQSERMQIGLAVAALMLCFTSLIPVHQPKITHAAATVVESVPAQSLADVCHIDATDDRMMQLFLPLDLTRPPIAVVRQNDDSRFNLLVQAINEAVITPARTPEPAFTLVLYERNGQPDYRLIVTTAGLLYDPQTRLSFQVSDAFREFLNSIGK